MPAAKLLLQIDQGASFDASFDVEEMDGDLVRLTGHTFRSQIRAIRPGRPALLDLSSENGRLALDPDVPNRLWIRLSPADTLALPAGTLEYDVLWIQPNGHVDRILEGPVKVRRAATRIG